MVKIIRGINSLIKIIFKVLMIKNFIEMIKKLNFLMIKIILNRIFRIKIKLITKSKTDLKYLKALINIRTNYQKS
jgi:hypothetical protein